MQTILKATVHCTRCSLCAVGQSFLESKARCEVLALLDDWRKLDFIIWVDLIVCFQGLRRTEILSLCHDLLVLWTCNFRRCFSRVLPSLDSRWYFGQPGSRGRGLWGKADLFLHRIMIAVYNYMKEDCSKWNIRTRFLVQQGVQFWRLNIWGGWHWKKLGCGEGGCGALHCDGLILWVCLKFYGKGSEQLMCFAFLSRNLDLLM